MSGGLGQFIKGAAGQVHSKCVLQDRHVHLDKWNE